MSQRKSRLLEFPNQVPKCFLPLLFVSLLFLCVVVCPSHSLAKEPLVLSVQPASAGSEEKVDYWYARGEKRYFFLPAYFNAESLLLTFSGADSVTIDGVEYRNGDTISLPTDREVKVCGSGFSDFSLCVLQAANIPAVFVETESGSMEYIHSKKGNRETGSLLVISADGTIEYRDDLDYIKGRGNSTFNYPKKPYQIKLKTGTSLGGLPASKKFVLLANYVDRSGIRNTISFGIARYSCAYAYTPACQSVDLYLNHEYAGCYLLSEKCEIGSKKLNIVNLEKATEKLNTEPLSSFPYAGDKYYSPGQIRCYDIPAEPEDITGGYLILMNNKDYLRSEPSGFATQRLQPFTVDQPKYCSVAQITYIRDIMQEIENGLFSKDGRDPATGRHYSELLDMKSFVHRYLQSEVTMDYDGQRPYFYKDSDTVDKKVYCGPVWDQDNTFGVSNRRGKANIISVENDHMRHYYWFPQAMKQPDFKAEMIKTYYEVYRPAYLILLGEQKDESGILRSVDEYMEEVRNSVRMDQTRWNFSAWRRLTGANAAIGNDPDYCADFLKDFIRVHMNLMDKTYPEPAT